MTAIFKPEGPLFRATEHAGGPWSPDMLQGSATTALMTREIERLTNASGFAVRRLTFDLWRPAGLRAFGLETEMLRDGRKAKTIQVRLTDGESEIGRCTALLTAQGSESPADPFLQKFGQRCTAGARHTAAGVCAEMEPLFPERVRAPH
ncbi:acyl-CoA thioesterase domain-containing protein [Bradyrhizobium sp. JYMT SZCCT0428]|uniref:acyl-CoA thioesterase domain-containing protein n=1 Tax=Bradyrhizobium sp. JYMT SZCCT0428 TaxID=2807673 RepID=UPI0028A10BAE|nr:acyl-CoA thioesterase domain-containing protein [Bradyrhizobium sp. JYMT SZCCT0428]